MTERKQIRVNDWNRTQWASSKNVSAPADATPRWSLWEWASALPEANAPEPGQGDSALSGFGRNPSGQHWVPTSSSR
jgi:hypothetical protein